MSASHYSQSPANKLLQNQAQLLHRLQTSNSELNRYKEPQILDNRRATPNNHHGNGIGKKNEAVLKDVLAKRKKDLKDELAIYRTDRGKLNEERVRLQDETDKMQASKDRWRIPNYTILDPIEKSNGQYKLAEEPLAMETSEMEAYAIRTEAKIPKLQADIELRRREVEKMRRNPQHLEGWTYEPHQSQTYHMVRDILVEVADGIMLFEPEKWMQDRLNTIRVLDLEEKRIQEHKEQLTKEKICHLMMEEIILEVSAKLSLEITEEYLSTEMCIRAMTQLLVINSAEAIATKKKEGREENDPAYSLVTGTYHQMVKERQKKRDNIWVHSQKLTSTSEEADKVSGMSGEDIDDDIKVLHFQDADVLQEKRNEEHPAAMRIFRTKELAYWKKMYPMLDEIKIVRRSKGVEMSSLSPDHRLLAFGYSHGDILVYDLWTSPINLVRLIGNDSIYSDPIISLKWSWDASRLISINESGSLHIWSMTSGGVATKRDIKDFEVSAGRTNTLPHQMTLYARLAPNDYKFKQGPLAEGGTKTATLGPSLSCFYPSHTLLGTQNEFLVGFDNGDILKCNIEPLIAAASDEMSSEVNTFPKINLQHQPNYISQDIPAALFRCHEHPLVLLGCVGNCGNLLSVDAKGYINIWKYNKMQLSHFGWFEPLNRYRLVMDEKTFVAVEDQEPQVVFTENAYKSKKRATKKALSEKLKEDRKQTQKEVTWLKLRTVGWHRKRDDDEGTLTEIWRPQEVPPDGCDFHVVVRDTMNSLLLSYTKVKFKEKANGYSAMLECKLSSDGNLLAFMLLFKQCPPKGAHISFVFIDVPEMKVRPYRINIQFSLSQLEFTRCMDKGVCSFQISRAYNVTGSEYLIVKVLDFLHVYSVDSGALVVQTSALPANGLTISPKHLTIEDQSMVDVACTQGRMIIINYSNKQSGIKIIDIADKNTEENRREMYATHKAWMKNKVASNTWSWSSRDLLDGQDNRHTTAYFRRLVLQLVDSAIQLTDGEFGNDLMAEYQKIDRSHPFYLIDQNKQETAKQDEPKDSEPPNEVAS
ncbi:uncharacterized protein [Antedon mediterranea]|uniref:uncharacterized protein isoform X2 n=1 Tax=Antedon mediterranea TaxID=105859 RepID=UPI003AF5BF1B